MGIKEFAKRLKRLNVDSIAASLFKKEKKYIIDLNQYQMYEQGIVDVPTKSIFQYAPFTVMYKELEAARLGRDTRSDHITLKDTGAFYKSMKVAVDKEGAIITGDMNKGNLEQQFPKALGLTDESKSKLAEKIKPDFIKEARAKLFR